ncbi:rhodanese-like domain-containing protein [Putridiphycobacter roseus]|uniref:Rhodanese-like domain-containing protein n=1 Tax=Putridiphycobacter roseus TaxID=2219161 RepID=A0A2W1N4E0_9FLAO|nr:rhodanese-like domain-containing protein [Putridiphycobacter roseus]PZE18704.1 rhodanese-like domain-containing protein [Putridiphycobacter roseus]
MKQLIVFSLFSIASFTACTQTETKNVEGTEEVISQTEIKRVSKAEFNTFKDKHPEALLLDVRTPNEFKNGTIGNAVNINFFDADFQERINQLDKTKPVLLFCQSGGRSGKALKVLKQNGFQTVLELQGGYGQY